MKAKSKLNKLILGTALMIGCYISKGNVMASMTEAYKNQRLNGKHVGAYVPNNEYKLPEGFNSPQGEKISSDNSSIEVQLQNANSNITIPSDRLIMYPNTTDSDKMAINTSNLQYVIDSVSNAGGGLVTVKEGNYYMTAGGYGHEAGRCHYVIRAKNNVTIAGTRGNDGDLLTTFLPYGSEVNGITMFQSFQDDWNNVKYLDNADFRDFKIDGMNATHTGNFYAQGKGFAFVIVKNCDWYNVEVQNTNGTGFGMDELINSTVTNCSANACGNYGLNNPEQAEPHVGASGFGIGYGYSADETISITYCLATNNKRFGIFFESQWRFDSNKFPYKEVAKLEASNNICAGNTYNIGGECCFNTQYTNNVTKRYSTEFGYSNPMNIVNNNVHYHFGKNEPTTSRNNLVTLQNGVSLNLPLYEQDEIYSDLDCNTWQCEPVNFVIKSKYIDAKSSTEFGIDDTVTRGEIAETLYRIHGSPSTKYNNLYIDVPSTYIYANSITWAYNENIAKGYQNGTDMFGPNDEASRLQACIMLYRYAKLKDPTISSAGDLSKYPGGNELSDQEHKEAMAWALDSGIISIKLNEETGEKEILPGKSIYKAELSAMVYKFICYMQNFSYLLGDMNMDNYVNSTDAAIVLDIFKNNNATDDNFIRGNINRDEVLNSIDAAMILDIFKNH